MAGHFGSDWPPGQGRELTGHVCNACHSLAIVKQQGLSRDSWDELLDWMVEEQGMDELGDEQRQQILNFLATHFGLPANGWKRPGVYLRLGSGKQ